MKIPAPDAHGRHAFPDGSYVWESRSKKGWCAAGADGTVVGGDPAWMPRYFPSAALAAAALGFTITED